MKTIRVQLQGGLGNQLFIWAMAHDLCLKTGRKVQLDFIKDKHNRADRPVEIERLLEFCSHDISVNQTKWMAVLFRIIDKTGSYSKTLQKLMSRILGLYDCETSYEIPDFSERKPRIIRGYFQTYDLVHRNSNIIWHELSSVLKREHLASDINLDLVMHIRRGDTRDISTTWGILSTNYYLNLINIDDAVTICIDEKNGIKDLTQYFNNATFLTPADLTVWQTLKVFSEAKTLIIANSTLSWWGAWMKSEINPETVFFPDSWRPADPNTIDNLCIKSAHLVKSEFEV